jgi:hypothetical protein
MRKFTVALFLLVLVIIIFLIGCDRLNDRQSTPDNSACPPCPTLRPPIDPLRGSTINDGFTTEARNAFIRKNVATTININILHHNKTHGLMIGGGTGVAITPYRILTAGHVVDQYLYYFGEVRSLLSDNISVGITKRIPLTTLATASRLRDASLLSPTHTERLTHTATISSGPPVREGELLWHFGRTTGWARGYVTDTSRDLMVQVDFRVAGGDSGGPVVRPDGTLVGLIISRNSSEEHTIDNNTSNRGYFIRIEQVLREIGREL